MVNVAPFSMITDGFAADSRAALAPAAPYGPANASFLTDRGGRQKPEVPWRPVSTISLEHDLETVETDSLEKEPEPKYKFRPRRPRWRPGQPFTNNRIGPAGGGGSVDSANMPLETWGGAGADTYLRRYRQVHRCELFILLRTAAKRFAEGCRRRRPSYVNSAGTDGAGGCCGR